MAYRITTNTDVIFAIDDNRRLEVPKDAYDAMVGNWKTTKWLEEELDAPAPDYAPAVKLFMTGTAATWLLTELDPDDERWMAFGLCDLGQGFPEIGYVSIRELLEAADPMRLRFLEVDRHYTAMHTLSQCAAQARADGRIVA